MDGDNSCDSPLHPPLFPHNISSCDLINLNNGISMSVFPLSLKEDSFLCYVHTHTTENHVFPPTEFGLCSYTQLTFQSGFTVKCVFFFNLTSQHLYFLA